MSRENREAAISEGLRPEILSRVSIHCLDKTGGRH